MRDPAHQRREQHSCEILCGIENGGGGATFAVGEPGGDDAADLLVPAPECLDELCRFQWQLHVSPFVCFVVGSQKQALF